MIVLGVNLWPSRAHRVFEFLALLISQSEFFDQPDKTQLYEAGLLQEAVVPMAFPWICWVTAAWIMSRSSWVRTMFVSQVGPSHWAWAGTIKRPKKIGMIALISVDIVVLHAGFQDGSDNEKLV